MLRYNTGQLTNDLLSCVRNVATLINRCGGLLLPDESVKRVPLASADGTKQLELF